MIFFPEMQLKVLILVMTLSLVSSAPNMRTKASRLRSFFSRFNDPMNNHFGDQQFDSSSGRFGAPSTDKFDTLPSFKTTDSHDSFHYNSDNGHFGNSLTQSGSAGFHYGSTPSPYNGILTPYSPSLKNYDSPFSSLDTTTSSDHETTTGLDTKLSWPSADMGFQWYGDMSNDFGGNLQPKTSHGGFGGTSDFMKNSHHEEEPTKELDPILRPLENLAGSNDDVGSYWPGDRSHSKFSPKKFEDDPLYQDYNGDLNSNDGHKTKGEGKYTFRFRDGSRQNIDYIGDDFGSKSRIECGKSFKGGSRFGHFGGSRVPFGGHKNTDSNVDVYS